MLSPSDIQALIIDLKKTKEKLESIQFNNLTQTQVMSLIKNLATIKGKIKALNLVLNSVSAKNARGGTK